VGKVLKYCSLLNITHIKNVREQGPLKILKITAPPFLTFFEASYDVVVETWCTLGLDPWVKPMPILIYFPSRYFCPQIICMQNLSWSVSKKSFRRRGLREKEKCGESKHPNSFIPFCTPRPMSGTIGLIT
jgi:hypothetical protein